MWRHKCESGEGGVRSEEMDEMKRKMNAKLQEAESQMEAALAKVSSLEKAKMKLAGELEDVVIEVERVSGCDVGRHVTFSLISSAAETAIGAFHGILFREANGYVDSRSMHQLL